MTKRKKASVKLSTEGWNGDMNTGTVSNPSCEDSTPRDKQTMLERAHSAREHYSTSQHSANTKPKPKTETKR
jgi:hypothetical protein